MSLDFHRSRDFLCNFDFHGLFIQELGWNPPSTNRAEAVTIEDVIYDRTRIAEMSAVPVFEITAPDGEIPKGEERAKIYKAIAESFAENLLIFVNGDRTRSLWYWAKWEGVKVYPRTDSYIKGQPVDLLLSKIGRLKIALDELDEDGNLPAFEVVDRLQKSLDVEKVTKKFYQAFQLEYQEFLNYVQGIDHEGNCRWCMSAILNRLIFVCSFQKKGFINANDTQYLRKKLTESQQRGAAWCYHELISTPGIWTIFLVENPMESTRMCWATSLRSTSTRRRLVLNIRDRRLRNTYAIALSKYSFGSGKSSIYKVI